MKNEIKIKSSVNTKVSTPLWTHLLSWTGDWTSNEDTEKKSKLMIYCAEHSSGWSRFWWLRTDGGGQAKRETLDWVQLGSSGCDDESEQTCRFTKNRRGADCPRNELQVYVVGSGKFR